MLTDDLDHADDSSIRNRDRTEDGRDWSLVFVVFHTTVFDHDRMMLMKSFLYNFSNFIETLLRQSNDTIEVQWTFSVE